MFIGNIVKLKKDASRPYNQKDDEFMKNAIKEGWLWLVVGCADEGIDFAIKPMYLPDESNFFIELGATLVVLYDEIELFKDFEVFEEEDEIFKILHHQRCNSV